MHDRNKYRSRSSFAIPSKANSSNGSGGREKWGIILAGGDGSRLLSLTRKIAGDDRPKQFCSIINGNTLLDETRRRVALAVSPERTMFVLTEKHDRYYKDTLSDVSDRHLVVQPKNSGTAPAILYSLLRLEKLSPKATVAFFPSDHFFSDDRAFMAEVDHAFAAASRQPDLVILLGIEPESPDEEYGWIEPYRKFSEATNFELRRVRRFWEKPAPDLARELMARGCLWNSFVMVGTVSAFLEMIRLTASDLYTKFAALRSKLFTPAEKPAIQILYSGLRDTNFSSQVLQGRPEDLAVLPISGSRWSDLGSPHRVFATLSRLGGVSLTKHDPRATQLTKLPERHYERTRVCSSEVV